jgi:hypothetical protein
VLGGSGDSVTWLPDATEQGTLQHAKRLVSHSLKRKAQRTGDWRCFFVFFS